MSPSLTVGGNKNFKTKPWERLIPTDLVGIAFGGNSLGKSDLGTVPGTVLGLFSNA